MHAALDQLRAQTLLDIEALESDLAGVIDATTDVATDDEHDPEGATIAFERARIAALADQARDHLVAIDGALARLANGTYGMCTNCGRPISPARLDALPSVANCISCASDPGGVSRRRR